MKASQLRPLFLVILVVYLLSIPGGSVEAQVSTIPHMTITVTGESMTAGFNNNVTVTVTNNYYGYPAIYDVDFGVSIPAGLTMFGDNHWHYDSMQLGQSATINFQVYAPSADIGVTYQGSITVTYKALGDVSYTQEVHVVSFSVYAYINLILYGVQMTPSITSPGGNTTISGNLLNTGNLAAYDANVSVLSNIVVPSSSSSTFIGEIDPNIPRPFSMLVVFKGNIPVGNYSVLVNASAIDDNRPGSPYVVQASANIQVIKSTVNPNQRRGGGPTGIIGVLFEILRYLEGAFFGSTSAFSFRQSSFIYARNLDMFVYVPIHG
ncbi:MAG: hypothetical protein ABSF00_05300 [Candidatus Bathyarchaeia archaeon]